jgi:hypothetical protein
MTLSEMAAYGLKPHVADGLNGISSASFFFSRHLQDRNTSNYLSSNWQNYLTQGLWILINYWRIDGINRMGLISKLL